MTRTLVGIVQNISIIVHILKLYILLITGVLLPTKCQFVRVPVISNDDCNDAYNGDITDAMVCAGHLGIGEKDACTGDSGGPLVCIHGGKAVITGVVSFGSGCAQPDFPGVYSRVAYVLDWIKENLV